MATSGGAVSPSTASSKVQLAALLLLVIAAVHAMAVVWLAPVVPEDDAYITLRYAANLAEGHGLVYNLRQNVLATTSPLYAVLLAAVAKAAGVAALPAASVRLNLLWIPAAAVLLVLLLRRLGLEAPLPELAAAWLLTMPETLTVALGGMEAWFFATLALAAFSAAAWRRWMLAGVFAAAATLVRPEGAFAALIIVVSCWFSDRGRIGAAVRGAVVPLAAWAVVTAFVYGSPLPQSVAAKVAAPGGAASVMRALIERTGQWLLGAGTGSWLGIVALGLSLALASVAVLTPRPGAGTLAQTLPLYLVLVLLEFVVGSPGWYPWYGGIVLVPWIIAVVLGFDAIAVRGGTFRPELRAGVAILVGALALVGLVGSVLATRLPLWPGSAYGVYTPYRLRILSYLRAANWLNAQAAPGSSAMAAEIGMFGFAYRNGPVLDPIGLVTREALDCRAPLGPDNPTGGAISPELVRRTRPDFLVTIPMYGRLLAKDDAFLAHYRLAAAFDVPHRPYPAYRTLVYAREDAALTR
jgi:hypothetical protein